jgi:hypothetical protein
MNVKSCFVASFFSLVLLGSAMAGCSSGSSSLVPSAGSGSPITQLSCVQAPQIGGKRMAATCASPTPPPLICGDQPCVTSTGDGGTGGSSGGGGAPGCGPATQIAGMKTAVDCGGRGTGGGQPIQVANQGAAVPGKPCQGGGGAVSGAIGTPISGPDTGSGPSGNEVNQVYLIDISDGSGPGALAGNGGFFLTTFNGQTWYQVPVTVPLYNGPVYVNMGNITVANNGPLSTSSLTNAAANALSSQSNSGMSGAVKNAVSQYLKGMSAQGTGASTPACFNPPWDGKATG